jgi:5-methylcytosine-specific restriction endonuclease McrA
MKRALRLVIDGKAEIVEADPDRIVRSERLTIPRPAVIRLTRFVHVPRRFRRHVTNTFLFARDSYRCQYCGRHMTEFKPREALTRDHLIPLSRGGTNDWTNVITACSPCNTRKGNRLPEEIGMHPLTNPVEPHFVHLSWAVRRLTPIQARYIRTFYGDQVLHQLEALEQRHPELPHREPRHAELKHDAEHRHDHRHEHKHEHKHHGKHH